MNFFWRHILENSDYMNSEPRIKTHDFSSDSCSTSSNVLVETLRKEIMPLITEIDVFDYWDTSIFIALFGIFGLKKCEARFKNIYFSEGVLVKFFEPFD